MKSPSPILVCISAMFLGAFLPQVDAHCPKYVDTGPISTIQGQQNYVKTSIVIYNRSPLQLWAAIEKDTWDSGSDAWYSVPNSRSYKCGRSWFRNPGARYYLKVWLQFAGGDEFNINVKKDQPQIDIFVYGRGYDQIYANDAVDIRALSSTRSDAVVFSGDNDANLANITSTCRGFDFLVPSTFPLFA